MNAYCVRLIKNINIYIYIYIGPKLIEWNMVDNYVTDIKYKGSLHN